ncbi:MAG: InlB B-repeat-containing protein [Pseudonocardiaceae bacterium]
MAPPKHGQQDAKPFSDLIVGLFVALFSVGLPTLFGTLVEKGKLGELGFKIWLTAGIFLTFVGGVGVIYWLVATRKQQSAGKRIFLIRLVGLLLIVFVAVFAAVAGITAVFTPKTQATPKPQLTVQIGGGGSVAGSRISCPPTCGAMFDPGKSVTLTPQPAAASIFDGWGGACAGTTATCTVNMNANQTVSATFHVLGPAEPEDCVSYDPSTLQIVNVGSQGYRLASGPNGGVGLKLLNNLQDAQDALSVASGYNQHCFVDRNRHYQGIEYWQGGFGKPGSVSLDHCTPYDPNDFRIWKANSKQWQLVQGNSWRNFSSESRAVRALRVTQAHTQECRIGSMPNVMQYWQ